MAVLRDSFLFYCISYCYPCYNIFHIIVAKNQNIQKYMIFNQVKKYDELTLDSVTTHFLFWECIYSPLAWQLIDLHYFLLSSFILCVSRNLYVTLWMESMNSFHIFWSWSDIDTIKSVAANKHYFRRTQNVEKDPTFFSISDKLILYQNAQMHNKTETKRVLFLHKSIISTHITMSSI